MADDDRTTTGEGKQALHGGADSDGGGVFTVGTVAAIGEKYGKFDSVAAKRYRQYQPESGSWKG